MWCLGEMFPIFNGVFLPWETQPPKLAHNNNKTQMSFGSDLPKIYHISFTQKNGAPKRRLGNPVLFRCPLFQHVVFQPPGGAQVLYWENRHAGGGHEFFVPFWGWFFVTIWKGCWWPPTKVFKRSLWITWKWLIPMSNSKLASSGANSNGSVEKNIC